jgi:hypothetical protein
MIRRWVGLGLFQARARFHLIKDHGELAALATALRADPASDHAAWATQAGGDPRPRARIALGSILMRGSRSQMSSISTYRFRCWAVDGGWLQPFEFDFVH